MLFFKRNLLLITLLFFAANGMSSNRAVFNILDYGANPDGETLCTKQIQAAIDACFEAGGGKVLFPKGKFLTGTIVLKDNVFIHLDPMATLLGSKDIDDYDRYLIYAQDATHFGITGDGTINGQGDSFWRGKERPYNRPSRTIKCLDCQDVVFRDFRLINSANWCIDVERCDRVTMTGLTLLNDRDAPNTDGIDPVSSSNVFISNCYIDTGDDCICPKSEGLEKPCENLVVTNCVLISDDSAIKLGTRSDGAIRNSTFSNIVIRNTQYGIGFYMKDGGSFEDIQFSNISIETTMPSDLENYDRTNSFAIFMDIEGRDEQTPLGMVRNVMFNDINIITADGNCLFSGMPEQNIQDLTLNNVRMRVLNRTDLNGRRKPRGTRRLKNVAINDRAGIQSYFTFINIDGLNIQDLVIEDDTEHGNFESYFLWGQNLRDVTLSGFQNQQVVANQSRPLLWFENPKGLFISGSQPVSSRTPFLSLQGQETRRVTLMGNDFSRIESPLDLAPQVNEENIYIEQNRMP
ncbi:hypothetical protein GF406_14845 [candidate division KSB1 bacterium]|nr:hypothetical protein [candidate division KSB1 bacterium]